MCRELAELAMELAQLAAAKARTSLAEAPHAANTGPERAAAPLPRTPKTIDPAVLFTRLSRAVQQAVALEARIAGDAPAARQTKTPPASTKTLRADPRWTIIRDIIKIALEKNPDRREIQREAEARLQEELQADPEQTLTTRQTLQTIIDDVGIEVDYHQLPDELLHPLLPPGFETMPIDHLVPPDWEPVDHLRLRARAPPA
jgi:hypothetical protein